MVQEKKSSNNKKTSVKPESKVDKKLLEEKVEKDKEKLVKDILRFTCHSCHQKENIKLKKCQQCRKRTCGKCLTECQRPECENSTYDDNDEPIPGNFCPDCTRKCEACKKHFCDVYCFDEAEEFCEKVFKKMCSWCDDKYDKTRCGVCFVKLKYFRKCNHCTGRFCEDCVSSCSEPQCEGGWTGQSTSFAKCCLNCLKACSKCQRNFCSSCFEKDKGMCIDCEEYGEDKERWKRLPGILRIVSFNRNSDVEFARSLVNEKEVQRRKELVFKQNC